MEPLQAAYTERSSIIANAADALPVSDTAARGPGPLRASEVGKRAAEGPPSRTD